MKDFYIADKPAEFYRAAASKHSSDAYESFERCDTDGFLSQWASGQNARLQNAIAELAEAGQMAEIRVLTDLEGNEVNARPIKTKFGRAWAIIGEGGKFTDFVTYHPKRAATLAKKGYAEALRLLPCVVRTYDAGAYQIGIEYYPKKWINPNWLD